MSINNKAPIPPFTEASAMKKVQLAENAWNSQEPDKVALAYTPQSVWRNRTEFITGREEIIQFLERKWAKERDYRLVKELWAYRGNRIAVRFAYEWHDQYGSWFRSYGNENWEFSEEGLMSRRFANVNDFPITQDQRKFYWEPGPRPTDTPSLTHYGL